MIRLLTDNQRFLLLLAALAVTTTSHAFVVVVTTPSRPSISSSSSSSSTITLFSEESTSTSTSSGASVDAVSTSLLDQLADVTFTVNVKRPMGVIFGENPKPMLGLVLDDVSPGLNGGAAGLRVGDQLVAVNGQVVVGRDFDSVMELLTTTSNDSSPALFKLCMFRGSAMDLYAVMASLTSDGGAPGEEEEEDVVVIDENYEAPRVVFEDETEKPLTAGSVLNIFKKIGLFGGMFGGETIQLDGSDASTVK
jgi:PDZ domain